MIQYNKRRTPDTQYRRALQRLLQDGVPSPTPQNYSALKVIGYQMRFDLRNGFPIISERDVYNGKYSIFYQTLGELFAFLNGIQTQQGLEKYGCKWWKKWTSAEYMERTGLKLEEGDLGPGSYGAAWTRFPMPDGGTFNQIEGVLEQLKKLPYIRRHRVSPWIPYYNYRGQSDGIEPKVVVSPCHGEFSIWIFPEMNKLTLHHVQRSADMPVGFVANLIQYAALTLMFAQVLGYEAWEVVHTIEDMHMYVSDDCKKSQMTDVIDMIGTHPQPFPKVYLDPDVTDLFSFRQEHFKVEEYKPQLPRRRIWTPV